MKSIILVKEMASLKLQKKYSFEEGAAKPLATFLLFLAFQTISYM